MESTRKCKSGNEAKKTCKVMTLDDKIRILGKLHGGVCSVAAGMALR
jgi:hypothetical protein